MTFKRSCTSSAPAALCWLRSCCSASAPLRSPSVNAGIRRISRRPDPEGQPNTPYDGRFTFVRINYDTAPGGYWYRDQPAWSHGYPVAEENLMKIMNEVSYLGANDEKFNTLALDDPELFKYPLVYSSRSAGGR